MNAMYPHAAAPAARQAAEHTPRSYFYMLREWSGGPSSQTKQRSCPSSSSATHECSVCSRKQAAARDRLVVRSSAKGMLLEKSQEFERRVRSLRKHLTLDFRPLKDTLAKGLEVLIDPEAAVYCTATVEALCDALFNVIIKDLHDEAATGVAPLVSIALSPTRDPGCTCSRLLASQDTKITVYHIQVALRSNADFTHVLTSVESAALVLEYFLDDATSKALFDRRLIATRDAKHLRPARTTNSNGDEQDGVQEAHDQAAANEAELTRLHERTRSEWQKREDDPFSEVDFAMVLKCVHPAFTLSYNATILLGALIRELLNEVCDLAQIETVQRRVPPELYLEDIEAPLARIFHAGESGEQIAKMARDCLERFRLRSRKGTSLTIRFRLFAGASAAAQSFRVTPQHMLSNVPKDASFAQLVPQMCKKCHVDAAAMAAIYRGHQIELQTTPTALSMPTGGIVYLVSKKWWDYTRRNEARRGLLSSLRPQDAQLKSLVEGTESKVKKDFQLAGASPTSHPYALQLVGGASPSALVALRRDESLEVKRMMKQHQQGGRSNNASSTSSLQSVQHGGADASNASSPSRFSGSNSKQQSGPSHHNRSSITKRAADKERKQQQQQQQQHYESDSEDPSQSSAAEEDSLSQLLKQRQPISSKKSGVVVPPQHCQPNRSLNDNNLTEDALSEMQQHHALPRASNNPHASPHHSHQLHHGTATVKSLAARSAQLMSTLDDAWLGFAAISGGMRSMGERMAKWQTGGETGELVEQQQQQDALAVPSQTELAELESELLSRLEKTAELVAQTTVAKDLVAQLVEQVQHTRRRFRSRATNPSGQI